MAYGHTLGNWIDKLPRNGYEKGGAFGMKPLVSRKNGTKKIDLKGSNGNVMCCAFYNPKDRVQFIKRCQAAHQELEQELEKVYPDLPSIAADGSAVHAEDERALCAAEVKVKQIITSLLPLDNPAGLFEHRRPFAAVKGTFYFVHVFNALASIPEQY